MYCTTIQKTRVFNFGIPTIPQRHQHWPRDTLHVVVYLLNRLSDSFGSGINRIFWSNLYNFRFARSTFHFLSNGLRHGSSNAFQEMVHFLNYFFIFRSDLHGNFRLIQSTFNAFRCARISFSYWPPPFGSRNSLLFPAAHSRLECPFPEQLKHRPSLESKTVCTNRHRSVYRHPLSINQLTHAVLWTTLAALIGNSNFSPFFRLKSQLHLVFLLNRPLGSGPLINFTPTTLLGLVVRPCIVFPGWRIAISPASAWRNSENVLISCIPGRRSMPKCCLTEDNR